MFQDYQTIWFQIFSESNGYQERSTKFSRFANSYPFLISRFAFNTDSKHSSYLRKLIKVTTGKYLLNGVCDNENKNQQFHYVLHSGQLSKKIAYIVECKPLRVVKILVLKTSNKSISKFICKAQKLNICYILLGESNRYDILTSFTYYALLI